MDNETTVSIRCLAYNHEHFIRQCLEGFVMQKTNFRFEAIVHDDASTDGTAAIILEYAKKYPDIIKPIIETENQYSKHDGSLMRIMNEHTQGKYVAICEGDDYWTDPYKLQKQVDFLEAHPDYVMCSHKYDVFIQEKNKFEITNDSKEIEYGLENLIRGEWYFHPLTVVYRNSCFNLSSYERYPISIDATLFYYLLKQGKGVCLSDNMAVYRKHRGGVWSEVGLDRQRLLEFNVRIGIYSVEQSREAATFLLTQFTKLISRKWMIKQFKIMFTSFRIISRHFGFGFTIKLFVNKFLLGKIYNY